MSNKKYNVALLVITIMLLSIGYWRISIWNKLDTFFIEERPNVQARPTSELTGSNLFNKVDHFELMLNDKQKTYAMINTQLNTANDHSNGKWNFLLKKFQGKKNNQSLAIKELINYILEISADTLHSIKVEHQNVNGKACIYPANSRTGDISTDTLNSLQIYFLNNAEDTIPNFQFINGVDDFLIYVHEN